MARSAITVRSGRPDDVEALAEIWRSALRPVDDEQRRADVLAILGEADDCPRTRVLVAECDGEVAGAVFLRVTTVTPVNREPCLQVISPHVRAGKRRRGVGQALMDAAVQYAGEAGVDHLASGALTHDRDANRFLARLGLAPVVTLRVGPTSAVRAKLGTTAARPGRAPSKQLPHVLAVRRTLRRREAARSTTD